MSNPEPAHRVFRVHARHLGACRARTLMESSFEAAAITYVEDVDDPGGEGGAMTVVVLDVDAGLEHCFSIDLETGQASTCV